MNNKVVAFQGQSLNFPIEKGEYLVPVKHICNMVDVDFKTQDNWLKKHPLFSQLYRLSYTTGADGKQYKMSCLSLFDCCLWLSGIQDKHRKDGSYEKQIAVLTWLRNQFHDLHKSIEIYKAENDYELELQAKKDELEQQLLEQTARTKELKKELKEVETTIEDIRFNRFTGQTALKFPDKE